MPAQPAPVSTPQSTEPPYPSRRYAWYVVGVLTLVYVFSFIDRQILSLLVRPLPTGVSHRGLGPSPADPAPTREPQLQR